MVGGIISVSCCIFLLGSLWNTCIMGELLHTKSILLKVVQHGRKYLERLFSLHPGGFQDSVRQRHGWLILATVLVWEDDWTRDIQRFFSPSKEWSRSLSAVAISCVSCWRFWPCFQCLPQLSFSLSTFSLRLITKMSTKSRVRNPWGYSSNGSHSPLIPA